MIGNGWADLDGSYGRPLGESTQVLSVVWPLLMALADGPPCGYQQLAGGGEDVTVGLAGQTARRVIDFSRRHRGTSHVYHIAVHEAASSDTDIDQVLAAINAQLSTRPEHDHDGRQADGHNE